MFSTPSNLTGIQTNNISLLFSLLWVLILFDTHLNCCNPVINSWINIIPCLLTCSLAPSKCDSPISSRISNSKIDLYTVQLMSFCSEANKYFTTELHFQRSCKMSTSWLFFHMAYITSFSLTSLLAIFRSVSLFLPFPSPSVSVSGGVGDHKLPEGPPTRKPRQLWVRQQQNPSRMYIDVTVLMLKLTSTTLLSGEGWQ